MELSVHNVRQVYASSDLVAQSHRGELNHGHGVVPTPTVPEQPGDVTKVVFSKEAENLKNNLQDKPLKQPKDKKKKEENSEDNNTELVSDNPVDVGINLDVNG